MKFHIMGGAYFDHFFSASFDLAKTLPRIFSSPPVDSIWHRLQAIQSTEARGILFGMSELFPIGVPISSVVMQRSRKALSISASSVGQDVARMIAAACWSLKRHKEPEIRDRWISQRLQSHRHSGRCWADEMRG